MIVSANANPVPPDGEVALRIRIVPVVGTATGGIPEVIVDGVTGRLVPIQQLQDGTGTPTDPERFVNDLAAALTEVVSDPARAAEMGRAGRERAQTSFSWATIAEQTRDVYRSLAGRH